MYKGQEGQWAYYLHRLSGLAIVVYLVDHIQSIGRVVWGPHAYNSLVIETYSGTAYRLGLIGLIGAVVYHTLNGLRITAIDFWPRGIAYQKTLWYAVWALFGVIYLPWATVMARDWWWR